MYRERDYVLRRSSALKGPNLHITEDLSKAVRESRQHLSRWGLQQNIAFFVIFAQIKILSFRKMLLFKIILPWRYFKYTWFWHSFKNFFYSQDLPMYKKRVFLNKFFVCPLIKVINQGIMTIIMKAIIITQKNFLLESISIFIIIRKWKN